MVDIKQIYWIAGLLEGEAFFGFKDNSTPVIALAMTDFDIITKYASLLNASVRTKNKTKFTINNKTIFYCNIVGKHAAALMMTIYSLMGERRRTRIKTVLDAWKKTRVYIKQEDRNVCSKGHELSQENIAIDSNLRIKCKICRREADSQRYLRVV